MCTFICKRGELINYTRRITAIISSCTLKVIMYTQGHHVRSKSSCTLKVTRYAQGQKIGKPNNLRSLWEQDPAIIIQSEKFNLVLIILKK